MPRSVPLIVRGEVFDTQAALERRIKQHLGALPMNRVIVEPFLAAVVNGYHPAVIDAGQCSTGEFEYLDFGEQVRRGLDTADRFRGGKLLITRFLPTNQWQDVTVYPWRKSSNPEQDIKHALREKIALVLPRPKAIDRCSRDGCSAPWRELEYEHIDPTFNQIAEQCIALMSQQEIDTRFGYDKFSAGQDQLVHLIRDSHPAILKLLELHLANRWEWLCPYHHRNVGAVAALEPVSIG